MSTRSMLRRVSRLERETGAGPEVCPGCGRGPGDGRRRLIPLDVRIPPADGSPLPPSDPDPCHVCGVPRVIILQVKADRELHPLDSV